MWQKYITVSETSDAVKDLNLLHVSDHCVSTKEKTYLQDFLENLKQMTVEHYHDNYPSAKGWNIKYDWSLYPVKYVIQKMF